MQRTVVEIADRAVGSKQITYSDAAIGTMYAAYDLLRRSGSGQEASIVTMRQLVEIMAKALQEQQKPTFLD